MKACLCRPLSRKLLTFLLLILQRICNGHRRQPNIVIALADDLGWSDVGYNNASGIKTPHIDKLARQGIILTNHYVQPLCSPSRASLLTGKYPIHIGAGLNENVFAPDEEAGLPLMETLLPEKLKSLGYDTALFGKWHLGLAKAEFLPTRRGFDRFYGFYTGAIDYYMHNQTAHRCRSAGQSASYLDLRDQESVVRNKTGEYSQSLFNAEALKYIDSRDNRRSFFLLMSYQNVHDPLQMPEGYTKKYQNFRDENRQLYAGMGSYLDDSIHNLTERIKHNGLWNDTLFIFMSDNGGNPTSAGYNWPLRGVKGTLWEGGIRSPSFLSGGFLERSGFTSNALVHVSDWLPTLLSVAKTDKDTGGVHRGDDDAVSSENNRRNTKEEIDLKEKQIREARKVGHTRHENRFTFQTLQGSFKSHPNTGTSRDSSGAHPQEADPRSKIDGVNVWDAITSHNKESPREYIIHNINNQSYAVRKGKWKLITEIDMGWAQPPEVMIDNVIEKPEREIDAKTFKGYLLNPALPRVRNGLFDIEKDSSEIHDLSEQNPDIVKELLKIIEKYRKTKAKSHRVYRCNLRSLEKARIEDAWGPFLD